MSCMAPITYIFCVDINSSNRADGKPANTAMIADEGFAVKHTDCLLQAGKGQDIELTSISSCASTARWGFLCQRSKVGNLLHQLCCQITFISEGEVLQV